MKNSQGQLSVTLNPERYPMTTVRHQRSMAIHNLNRYFDNTTLTNILEYLIAHSALAFPPVSPAFACLGSAPCNLNRIVSFDKFNVLDLGVIRQFCDLSNTVLSRISSSSLSRLMGTANLRHKTLPCATRQTSHNPFRCNPQDASITGKIRRESVPYLWVCLMDLSDLPPTMVLVQFALTLDVVNHFLCSRCEWTLHDIERWQFYLFRFDAQISEVFKVDITTEMHRLMCHLQHALVHIGCIRRGSSKENDMADTEFKIFLMLQTSTLTASLHSYSHHGPVIRFHLLPPLIFTNNLRFQFLLFL